MWLGLKRSTVWGLFWRDFLQTDCLKADYILRVQILFPFFNPTTMVCFKGITWDFRLIISSVISQALLVDKSHLLDPTSPDHKFTCFSLFDTKN